MESVPTLLESSFHKNLSFSFASSSTVASLGRSNTSGTDDKESAADPQSLRNRKKSLGISTEFVSSSTEATKEITNTSGAVKKKTIIDVSREGFGAHYVLGDVFGENATNEFNEVYEAVSKTKEGDYIVKTRKRSRMTRRQDKQWRMVMETIMQTIGEDSRVHSIDEILMDRDYYYIVSRRLRGGELYKYLVSESEVAEQDIKRIIRDIVLALQHLHNQGLIHRDVKPENLIFSENYGNSTVKLIDFDLVQQWSPRSPSSRTVVGTPGFIAPECFLGNFSPVSDIFSVGVILFVLMTGDLPYSLELTKECDYECESPKSQKSYTNIVEEELDWESDPWPQFPDIRDLCQRLLDVNPETRVQNVEAVLAHPFLAG